ncbi:DUF2786 domain-containing protein [Marinomonas mediterranea]|uniref:Uncharacterized protein n=1 Tax=Marinomonas mediterranea (strain ATCC 700492 / JCM 21426 / NBRC 103028 / MMB-1) TaxID=717774 RepID=F2K1E3_MARM1|nr:DUF2786 domain-containing protein [Marinomonas mediterranea]ADZ91074.1 hypothetical protein Marme_1818 [Marinomonas mediterranea MMB-1]WCN17209.1 DUF2786 domain-containing protein [Marinomonas mediterranea MMB-1]
MSNRRYEEKIRKLLALSQSDNPHEAEIAKRQAMALMKKHKMDEGDLSILEMKSRTIRRKSLKEFECYLIKAITQISGTYCTIEKTVDVKSNRYQWLSSVVFIGFDTHAQLASYSFDVLYTQLERERKNFKKKYNANAMLQDQFCLGWAYSACEKLINVFGKKNVPEDVTKHRTKVSKDHKPVKFKSIQLDDSKDGLTCGALGFKAGQSAKLNNATTSQRATQLRIGGLS